MLAALSDQSLGIFLAILTSFFWAISPLCWASVGKRVGSFSVLLLRGLLATTLLLCLVPLVGWLSGRGLPLPTGPQLRWILLSGVLGMAVGDAFYYEALVTLGPRRTTQILTLAPLSAVLLGWVYLHERLSPWDLAGIATVLAATGYAVLTRQKATRQESDAPTATNIGSPSGNTLAPQPAGAGNGPTKPQEPGHVTFTGIAFAVAGAICVGAGAVTMRRAVALGPLDLLVATLLRVGSSTCLLWLIPLFTGRLIATVRPLREKVVLSRMIVGTLAGPAIGMLCYIGSIKHIESGVASTLSSMSPLFLLPLIAWRYQARLTWDIVVATALASAGVGLISLG